MITLIRPRKKLTPANYGYAFEQMKERLTLNEKEEKLFEAFRRVTGDSIWIAAIREMFIDYTVLKFRELCAELMSQLDDSPELMYQILGKEAYDLLNELKP